MSYSVSRTGYAVGYVVDAGRTSLRRNPRLRVPSGPDLGSPAALERLVSCPLSGYTFSHLRIDPSAYSTGYTPQICRTIMLDGLLVRRLGRSISSAAKHQALGPSIASRVGRFPPQPALPSFYPQLPLGISIGRNAVFPSFLQQLPASRRMTVICATKAIRKSSPYPYQSTFSQSYCRQSRASSGMSSPQEVKPAISVYGNSSSNVTSAASNARPTPAPLFRLPTHHHFDVGGVPTTPVSLTAAALAPVLEDIYFDSNGVLFRNGLAIVDQHGSIIRRPIAERPLPVFRPTFVDPETLVLRTNRAVIGQNAHRIAPPFFDPLPAFIESRPDAAAVPVYPRGPVPPGLESLVEHLHHNGQAPAANNSAVDSSGDAQMRPALETRGRLTGDPARIAEATRVYNQAHDFFVNQHYNIVSPPAPCPASEPQAPTTDPIETDSEPADTQSEPLLTNDQGDPVSVTYPLTNFSRPTTPNPPGFFDPKDYHRLDDDQIHDLLRRDHEPGHFDRYAFGPQQLTDLYQSAMSAMVSNYTHFPPRDGAECADWVQTFKFITRRYHSLDRVMRRR
ncbi:hypothetical protein PCANC_25100 [Puccinia coronata f. sp. avenae]|uniref:Uncharacterized protein n=1 Tax=Puccinia coronata f. sp. avenae TaxID=200324 RepID=A0A2N5UDF9_9BASI|nr:hypothetical protein PCANC_25100 [Puccinia coronata f. sp. avenae]